MIIVPTDSMSRVSGIAIALLILTFSVNAQNGDPLFSAPAEAYGDSINSVYDEQAPVFTPDGEYLYFTRRNHPSNTGGKKDPGDIWYSQKQADGSWGQPVHAGNSLNNPGYNAVVGFADGGNVMYLQNLYEGKGKGGQQGVSYARRSGSGWGTPNPVNIPYFYNRAPHQSISLSPDGSVMLMAVESKFSYGAEDIYVSLRKAADKFGEPINLGRTINTRYQEMTPHLAADNKTLFFASNGHGGKGSRDIFKAVRQDETWKSWSEPVNVGGMVNSQGVELSFFIPADSEYAYFTSTQNSDGYGDLRRIKLRKDEIPEPAPAVEEEVIAFEPEPATNEEEIEVEMPAIEEEIPEEKPEEEILYVKEDPEPMEETPEPVEEESDTYIYSGRVNDQQSGNGIPAGITIVNLTAAGDTTKMYASDNGSFKASLEPGNTYTIKANAKGYLSSEVTYEATGNSNTSEIMLELLPLEVGTTVNLDNVLFQQGTATILPGSEKDLERVYEVLSENPNMKIQLAGHTDNRGIGRLNIKLSRERVEAVKEYLVSKGIKSKRIEGVGYGGTKPIASNATEETRRLNRRVEFIILEK